MIKKNLKIILYNQKFIVFRTNFTCEKNYYNKKFIVFRTHFTCEKNLNITFLETALHRNNLS